ncbi:MAG TPA: hypothetical protein VK174_15575, partial [Chitinophagales bacterium]|nr:hypothetical protein [Chitinophagales bacterium]
MILRIFIFLAISHYYLFSVQAQCITSFPYSEDFEAGNGNWASGGTGDDWAWGVVSKGYIQTAASGSNCWVTGGLTNSFYNLGELSYVQSPCFDFSGMQKPYIRFNIYWETENGYDGAGFQYSTDGGTSWQNVGAYTGVSCQNNAWFNNSNINYLGGFTSVRHGWSGNVQQNSGGCQGGNGSGRWINASQCMPYLAGQSNVLFRFIFGAGTQCNDYDGFAFDDVYISEAPAGNFDFTYACAGEVITITPQIQPIGYDCYDSTFVYIDGVLEASGAGGIITYARNLALPSPGMSPTFPHTIAIRYKGLCHDEITVTKRIPDFAYNIATTSPTCAGASDGQAIITFTNGNIPRFITWSSVPGQQNDTAYNLHAAIYTVRLIDSFNCEIPADTFVLNDPQPIDAGFT